MKYRVQFCRGWRGIWPFDAANDVRAWETAWKFIREHTSVVEVGIDAIFELDDDQKIIRKLKNYDDYFVNYKIYFKDERNIIISLFEGKDDLSVWNVARKKEKELGIKIDRIEEVDKLSVHVRKLDNYSECKKAKMKNNSKDLDIDEEKQKEQAMYKVCFSDGKYSGPYIVEISENDTVAINMAKYKLQQHTDYNSLDVNELKITQVEEINEDLHFTVNVERKEKKKNRLLIGN